MCHSNRRLLYFNLPQNVKLVVEHAHLIALSHLVASPLPSQALVVERLGVGPDEYGLPVVVRPVTFGHAEHSHVGLKRELVAIQSESYLLAFLKVQYRVTHLLANLGWVDFDLGCSLGWWAATVATYCPSKPGELPKSKSTQPRFASRWVTLYRAGHPICRKVLKIMFWEVPWADWLIL